MEKTRLFSRVKRNWGNAVSQMQASSSHLAMISMVIEGQTAELGGEHPDTSRTIMNLANVYRNLGEYLKSEALYMRESLKVGKSCSDPNILIR